MASLVMEFGILFASCLVAFLAGRWTHQGSSRVRELEVQLEEFRKEHEIALAELDAARDEWKRLQIAHERYRSEVVDHFSGTSELLQDLALNYRVVFDHLTQGAKSLCPDGALKLDPGAEAALLPPGRTREDSAEPEGEAQEAAGESGPSSRDSMP
ncbi:YhcB family protein [Myxococcota bacterium]|nr:YhcB family protein [Myxococcota bacterium]